MMESKRGVQIGDTLTVERVDSASNKDRASSVAIRPVSSITSKTREVSSEGRASVTRQYSRRQSRIMSTFNRKIFEEPKHITSDDITAAIKIIAKDGKTIRKEDVWHGATRYFSEISPRLAKLFSSGKEEMTKEILVNLLTKKKLPAEWFQESYKLFHDEDKTCIGDDELARLIRQINKYELVYRNDMATVKKRYDRDGDGILNVEDFKNITIS